MSALHPAAMLEDRWAASSSGFSPLTYLAWEAVLVAATPPLLARWIVETRAPSPFGKVLQPLGGVCNISAILFFLYT